LDLSAIAKGFIQQICRWIRAPGAKRRILSFPVWQFNLGVRDRTCRDAKQHLWTRTEDRKPLSVRHPCRTLRGHGCSVPWIHLWCKLL